MLGIKRIEKTNNQRRNNETVKHYNNKIIKAYQKAYASYQAACERYDRLMQAYKILGRFKTEKSADTGPAAAAGGLPYTMKIMRGMIEEAHREKSVIAGHARECIKHLHILKYEM